MEFTSWAATEKGSKLIQTTSALRKLEGSEILIEVSACGVCHSDLHLIDNDWGISRYPLVPGHEIFGKVIGKGPTAQHGVGTWVGVGWQHSSCLNCRDCISGNENLCDHSTATCLMRPGGFASHHIADSRFAFEIPNHLRVPEAAPLLCGGATVYSPLKLFAPDAAMRVGIIGFGGLGELAAKMAVKKGLETWIFSSSTRKQGHAKKLGVENFASSVEPSPKIGRHFDLLLVTAFVPLDWRAYLSLLRSDGTLCFVGVPAKPLELQVSDLLNKRLRVAASPIASRATLVEMLEFCDRHRITAAAEAYPMPEVNQVLGKMRERQIEHRAVLVNA